MVGVGVSGAGMSGFSMRGEGVGVSMNSRVRVGGANRVGGNNVEAGGV